MVSEQQPGGTYQLLAIPTAAARDDARGGWRHVGCYHDLETTLRARVDDVMAQLEASDGWLVTCEHLVIGPGPDGATKVASHVTQLGADPARDRVPDPHNGPATRRWLLAAHKLSQ
jgi:hypothetical protein